MKHWDGQQIDAARPVALEEREMAALARDLPAPGPAPAGRRPRQRAGLGSMVGLGLSLAFLAGLAIALAPSSPVARELRR